VLAKFSSQFRDRLSNWRRRYIAAPIALTPVLVASIGVSVLLLGLRQFGKLEPLELGAYDQMLRSRPTEKPDPRILVVTVTEEDIQRVGKWPLSDATMANLLEKLQKYNPRVIGLDIYRDLAVQPGHQRLVTQLGKSDRIITVCKTSDINHSGVAPPSSVPQNRVGFSDLAVDSDGVIRRALLFVTPGKGNCKARFSFSFQLASRYLAKEGIESYKVKSSGYMGLRRMREGEHPQSSIPNPKSQIPNLKSQVEFPRLNGDAGGYQGADIGGYQILLNYRSAQDVAQEVTLTQVLNDRVRPEWIRDRIVLIGVQAPSIDDAFYTPYSAVRPQDAKMPGVVVHAQVASQILSAVLDGRPLIWYWPWWGEILDLGLGLSRWVWGRSAAASSVAGAFRGRCDRSSGWCLLWFVDLLWMGASSTTSHSVDNQWRNCGSLHLLQNVQAAAENHKSLSRTGGDDRTFDNHAQAESLGFISHLASILISHSSRFPTTRSRFPTTRARAQLVFIAIGRTLQNQQNLG